jgi:hypothetical protein
MLIVSNSTGASTEGIAYALARNDDAIRRGTITVQRLQMITIGQGHDYAPTLMIMSHLPLMNAMYSGGNPMTPTAG